MSPQNTISVPAFSLIFSSILTNKNKTFVMLDSIIIGPKNTNNACNKEMSLFMKSVIANSSGNINVKI